MSLSAELRNLDNKPVDGIDLYYDNVGGNHLEAALDQMKPFSRIVLCGMISQYNETSPVPGPSNMFLAITKRLKLQGFIVRDHFDTLNQFYTDMSRWVNEGKISGRKRYLKSLKMLQKPL